MIFLTPNQRLAGFLQQHYNAEQLALGKEVWEAPKIYPFNTWLNLLWTEVTVTKTKPKILTAAEQQLIWEEIITNSNLGEQLLNIKTTAEQAIKALGLSLQWGIDLTEIQQYADLGSDSEIFIDWLIVYQEKCAQHNWLDHYSMVDLLITNLDKIKAKSTDLLAQKWVFYAFQEFTPQQERLIQKITDLGIAVEKLQNNVYQAPKQFLVKAKNPTEEYYLAANWAKQQYQDLSQGNKNLGQIGIVVPNLTSCRKDLVRVFNEVFATEVYNISAPEPMITYTMIDTALLVLQLSASHEVKLDIFSQLLRSNYIINNLELNQRSMLDITLRSYQESKFSWEDLDKILATAEVPIFNLSYINWRALCYKLSSKKNVLNWLEVIKEILLIWQWPRDILNSIEQDLATCWELLLVEYIKLDEILGQHNFARVYQTLKSLALTTPFLPKTENMPIQVLGTLEAAGMQFDKLWLLGMHREVWPAEPKPVPFIPFALQCKYALPRSSPQRELVVAKNLTEIFLSGGKQEIIISYPQQVEDFNTDLSPLFKNLGLQDLEISISLSKNKNKNNLNTETIIDDAGPELLATTVKNGTRILRLQSHCPFWAFAEIRLGAVAIKETAMGLTAAERGEVVHAVLAKFWQQIKTQDRLQEISDNQLAMLLADLIKPELMLLKIKRPQTLNNNYLTLEIKRTQQLLQKWLTLEKQRDSFTVYKIEQAFSAVIGPLKFKIRIDRIDQLLTNEIIILDYKTSLVSMSDWLGERPIDPQLPVYYLAVDLPVEQIAFAIIRPDKLKLENYAASEYKKNWQDSLIKLAEEFVTGKAVVDPLKGVVTCGKCKLISFCRV